MEPRKKYSKLKRTIIVLSLLILAFFAYVEIVNRNSAHMTYRQKILKAIYPSLMWVTNLTGKNNKVLAGPAAEPPIPFYTLTGTLNNGNSLNLEQMKGKKVLLVNTASDCGYTNQYADLEKLYQQYAGKLVIIGFPANDFKEQEKGSDTTIAEFCKLNYGVSFPLMKKSSVVKGPEQNAIFHWLTNRSENGWNEQPPSWNFCKYLVDEQGKLIGFYASSVEPLSPEIIKNIEK